MRDKRQSADPSEAPPQHASHNESSWIKDFAAEYDFCMILPEVDGGFSETGKTFIESLRKLDFEMFAYRGNRKEKSIVILIRAPLAKLRAFADRIDFTMKLDGAVVKKMLEHGNSEANIAPVIIPHRPDITNLQPYEHIFAKYSRNVSESIYWKEPGAAHPFREIVRIKLCAMLLESRASDGTQHFNLKKAIEDGDMLGCFPLHDRARTQTLDIEWKVFPRRGLPLYYIKEYFGEKIAVYFAFMQHYTVALTLPAFVGIPIQLYVWSTGNPSASFLPVFSFFIAMWSVSMLEFWKRSEKTTALKWGTIDFEQSEADRPGFHGDWIDSYVDGSKMRYFPMRDRRYRILTSGGVVFSLIILVLGIVVSIYVIRFTIIHDVGQLGAQVVASVANAVQILVLNIVYAHMALRYTERENHRTETQFEDSMITKIFIFQFVNSYASFFYLAFIASSLGDCPATGCMGTLGTNLAIIFGSRIIVGQFKQNLMPYIQYQHRLKTDAVAPSSAQTTTKATRPERELLLDDYDQMASSLEDYSEVAIIFGYTALFVTALPIAAFFSLLANIAEIKTDGWKLIHLHKRPFPRGCENIGTWQSIFLLISVISVITNAGLTVFTMNTLNQFSDKTRYWIFIVFQWFCFILQAIIMEAIPDIPERILIQLARTDFIRRKLIDKVSDDNESDAHGSQGALDIQEYPDFGDAYAEQVAALSAEQVQVYKWRSL